MIIPVKVSIERLERSEFSIDGRQRALGAEEDKYRVSVQALDTDRREMRTYSFESVRNLQATVYRDVGSITVSKLTLEDEIHLRALRLAINEELGESE